MTLEAACWIIAIAAIICGLTVWAIHAAEQRIRALVRAGLTRPDDGHTAALLRSRALEEEYKALVLEEQSKP